jgi:hypothetical protein
MDRKQIKNFGGYEIDTNGVVYSLPKKRRIGTRELKQFKDDGGYLMVDLRENGRHTKKTHRLVAETFLPNPNNHPMVCHKDGNQLNNNVDNLYWGTAKQNMADSVKHGTFALLDKNYGEGAGNSKLNEKQVRVIKHILTIPNHINQLMISKIFNISPQTICYIASGKLWKHVIV